MSTSSAASTSALQRTLEHLIPVYPAAAASATAPQLEPPSTTLKLTSPLLERFETQGILTSPFALSAEEEALVMEIVKHAKLPPVLTLYDVLCFDLDEQLASFDRFILREGLRWVRGGFQAHYLSVEIQKDENLGDFITSLRSLTQDCLTLIPVVITHAEVATTSEKLQMDGRNAAAIHIMKTLNCRVRLLTKFLEHRNGRVILIDYPLSMYRGCEQLESDHKTRDPFSKMAEFLQFSFDALTFVDAAVLEQTPHFLEVKAFISGFANLVPEKRADQALGIVSKLEFWLKPSAPFLALKMLKVIESCLQHFNEKQEYSRTFMNRDRSLRLLRGDVPDINESFTFEEENPDELAYFKSTGLLPQTFRLSNAENRLFQELFAQYPLSGGLTFLDLLAFALHDRMGHLENTLPAEFREQFQKIRAEVGVFYYQLCFGYQRGSEAGRRVIGVVTSITKMNHLFPSTYIEKLDQRLGQLKNLMSAPRNPKNKARYHALQKKLNGEMERTLTPVRDLLGQLLQDHVPPTLILNSTANCRSGKIMDEPSVDGKECLEKYWNFHREIHRYGCKNRLLGIELPCIHRLDEFFNASSKPTRKKQEALRRAVIRTMEDLLQWRATCRKDFHRAVEGSLSYKDWYAAHRVDTSLRNQRFLTEELHHRLALIEVTLALTSDLLELAEKRLFTAETLSTRSCYFRLIFNWLHYTQEPTKKASLKSDTSEWMGRMIEPVLSQMTDNLQTPLFKQFFDFLNSTFRENFRYYDCLSHLFPLANDLALHHANALKSLKALPAMLRAELRERLNALSLDELRALNAETIKNEIFNGCLPLLRPLLMHADMLALLQERHFYDEAALIPPELADVMELDGVDKLLKELIDAKTPAAPIPIPLPIEEPPPPITVQPSVPEKKKEARAAAPKPSSSSSTSSDFDPQELIDLTKSRKILSKLEKLGFFAARQTGSHVIMKAPAGGSVVVPNHPEISLGTRRSIAAQADQALNKK